MRTEWQSGTVYGDNTVRRLRGNRLIGNERYAVGKANPTYAAGLPFPVVAALADQNERENGILKHRDGQKQKKGEKGQSHLRWVIRIFLLSVSLSAVLSLCSGAALDGAGFVPAALILVFVILLGIVFDVIGVAVTAADAKPFHSMASHRVKGAGQAIILIKNAEKVASFCNDVVGDICGIVSGSTAAVIVTQLQRSFGWRTIIVSTAVTALISGLTIAGKAIGKKIAMKRSKNVVYFVAKLMAALHIG